MTGGRAGRRGWAGLMAGRGDCPPRLLLAGVWSHPPHSSNLPLERYPPPIFPPKVPSGPMQWGFLPPAVDQAGFLRGGW